jgi:acyl-CoA dehydrogenase-like protein
MDLTTSDRQAGLAVDAAAAFAAGGEAPPTTSFTERCIVAREAGRAAPDRRFVLQAWAGLLGWDGHTDVTVALDPGDGPADHVPRAATVATAIVADRAGWAAELDLRSAERIPQPTIDDPDAVRVVFAPGALAARREHDVAGTVPLALILLAADCTGAAVAALDATLAHVRERPLFGGVVADLQVVRHRCADMATAVTRCWDLVLDAAGAVDRDDDPAVIALRAAHTKVFVAEHARRVTEEALRTAGGRGILADQPWSRWYRRVKGVEPMLGAPRVHRAAVARASLARWR